MPEYLAGYPATNREVPAIAWRGLVPPLVLVVTLLSVFSNRYGFERDELYFSMLKPAWGYVDQPPLVPLLSHALASMTGGGPWLLRVPATLCAAGCLLITTLIARELGGGTKAQTWTAWGMATTSAVIVFGHVFLTSTPDLVFWPAACLCVLRAELRMQPRWWLAAGAVAGIATYNKLLIGVPIVGIALGLALVGPRRRLSSPYLWGATVLALLLAAPNIVYQVVNGWPELDMGRALADHNAADVRTSMWFLLVVLLGPPMVVIWLAGLRALARDVRVRFLVVAFIVLVAFTFVAGTQAYYPIFLLPVPFAAGIVAMERHLGRIWAALFVLNGAVSAAIGLPLASATSVGATPIPSINQTVPDSVGWPTYVAEIAEVYDNTSRGGDAVVVTSNYGEAGAVARYRPDVPVYSAQNALHDQARPADDVTTVVFVGGELDLARTAFTCHVVTHLDNRVGVDNEEQGQPVAVCEAPRLPWAKIWALLRHLD
ncbi:ArnT family glycosyltransferase [Kribbella sp. GL6]|uniref:ArnT family glycosyltransferase n=1 Tax=Kribbella sp. GL6 TaxID=3419765 RepID=UPI003D042D70